MREGRIERGTIRGPFKKAGAQRKRRFHEKETRERKIYLGEFKKRKGQKDSKEGDSSLL